MPKCAVARISDVIDSTYIKPIHNPIRTMIIDASADLGCLAAADKPLGMLFADDCHNFLGSESAQARLGRRPNRRR
jgi:hypothetical protein